MKGSFRRSVKEWRYHGLGGVCQEWDHRREADRPILDSVMARWWKETDGSDPRMAIVNRDEPFPVFVSPFNSGGVKGPTIRLGSSNCFEDDCFSCPFAQ